MGSDNQIPVVPSTAGAAIDARGDHQAVRAVFHTMKTAFRIHRMLSIVTGATFLSQSRKKQGILKTHYIK